jgi:hypothetical protein
MVLSTGQYINVFASKAKEGLRRLLDKTDFGPYNLGIQPEGYPASVL